MAHFRHFFAMLWKNWLLKRRSPLSSCCELLLPLGFVLIMVGLYTQFATVNNPDLKFVDEKVESYPVAFLPGRLAMTNQRLAVVASGPSTLQLRDDFLAHIRTMYPAFNGSTIGGTGFTHPLLRSIASPSLADVAITFDTEAKLNEYIKHPDYKTQGYGPGIWAAIVFNNPPPNLDYAIRANSSDVANTRGSPVNLLQRGADLGTVRKYTRTELVAPGGLFARPGNVNPVFFQSFSGFMTLQLMVDRWVINSPAPLASMNPTQIVNELFTPSLGYVLLSSAAAQAMRNETTLLNATNPAKLATIAAAITQWMKAESYAPQQTSLIAFPVSAYKANSFYNSVLPLFAFFFVIVVLFPISRLIRGVVMEKEAKIREGMRMMGMTDASWYFSWTVLYAGYFCLLSLLITIFTKNNIFSSSQFGFIWGFFFLFGLSCTAFAQLISVFFSRAKTASTVGIVLYLGGYFPFFAVQPAEISYQTKTLASLLAPTAFGLGVELIGTFEADGTGASRETLNAFVNNWNLQQSIGMLILDTILYSVLAWYIDAVLPASMREFGVPRPLNFPFTVAYWREVLNMPPTKNDAPNSPLMDQKSASGHKNASGGIFSWFPCFRSSNSTPSAHGAGPDPALIEEPDSELKNKEREGRAVTISKLRKEFNTPDGTKVAVDDIDMTMYEGQIFVLLGHNGAGKTTTISMLTGLTEPTEGSMNVFGRDVSVNLSDIRQDLGVCPQHDVLWPELTVQEHLEIFCAIKGVPREKVKTEIDKALKEVGLTEKLTYKSGMLSGGQKRKLSVCIALCGGSRFILLDEPTSGMDPYSRRSTWQILQNAREGRVLLLTTHFMDEADILGDRICIMANGQVKCCGSSMFLKKSYGVGYILTLVREAGGSTADVSELIRSFVPEAEISSDVGAELSFRLPLTSSSAFPAMLAALDERAKTIGVGQYGVSVSDIQDVFMKVAHGEHLDDKLATTAMTDVKTGAASLKPAAVSPSPGDSDMPSVVKGPGAGKSGIEAVRAEARVIQSGVGTFFRHFGALFRKRWQASRRDAKALCYQILIPVIMTGGGLALLKASTFGDAPGFQFSTAVLNTARGRAEPQYQNYLTHTTFMTAPPGPYRFDDEAAVALLRSIPATNATTLETRLQLNTVALADMDNTDLYGFVRSSKYPIRDYERMSSFLLADRKSYPASKYGAIMLMGNTPGVTRLNEQVSNMTLPASNALSYTVFHNTSWKHGAPTLVNLMNSAAYRAASRDPTASITTRTNPLPFTVRQSNLISAFFTFSAAVIIVLAFAFIPASVAIFVTKEREVSAKHQQLISGVSISAYWLSNYAFDLLAYVVPCVLSILLTTAFDIKEFTDTDKDRLRAFVALFILYGTSVTPFTYVMTYLFKSHSTAQNVSLIVGVISMILMIAALIMSQVESTCREDKALRFLWRLLPGFSLGNGLVSLSFLAQLPLIDSTCDAYAGIFKAPADYQAYNALDNQATGYNLIYMAILSPVYMIMAIMIDIALAHPRFRLLLSGKEANGVDVPEAEDEDVAEERSRVAAQTLAGVEACTDVVQLRGLRKMYPGGKTAVKNLSYGMPVGEVFGFLGINGAGKTTTLQMLSGDVLPTAGTALLGGYDIIRQQPDVRRLLGYCPQWDALLENLTVKEHLEMYARIKGVPEPQVQSVVDAKLQELDLGQFSNKLAMKLSGGNKRKLSVAIALIGNPPIVFLDEPSTGMDPVAKRFMWKVISKVATQSKMCSIILTTHSMEEVEALCTRIGIMVGGRLRCLGTSQHLKNRHGQGFVSELRIAAPTTAQIDQMEARVAEILVTPPGAAWMARKNVLKVATACGVPDLAKEVSDSGTGWAIQAAFVASNHPSASAALDEKAIPVREFAEWWADEMAVGALMQYMGQAFPGATCVERQGLSLRFRLPASSDRLCDMFARLEESRKPNSSVGCTVASYTLGQTSLEQIFVQFASQQDEERNVARGVMLRTPEPVSGQPPMVALVPVAPHA